MHRVLLLLAPETAHHVGMFFIRIWQTFRFCLGTTRQSGPVILIRREAQLRFSNRLGLAAGFDKNAEVFAALSTFGFGFVEVGTVTPLPQPGNPTPRLWRHSPRAIVNHMGFNNCGLERFCENVKRYRAKVPGTVLFANVGKGRATPE